MIGGKLKIATLTSREFSGKFSNLPCDSVLPCLHLLWFPILIELTELTEHLLIKLSKRSLILKKNSMSTLKIWSNNKLIGKARADNVRDYSSKLIQLKIRDSDGSANLGNKQHGIMIIIMFICSKT